MRGSIGPEPGQHPGEGEFWGPLAPKAANQYEHFAKLFDSKPTHENEKALIVAARTTQISGLMIAALSGDGNTVSKRRAIAPIISHMTAFGVESDSLPPSLWSQAMTTKKWKRA